MFFRTIRSRIKINAMLHRTRSAQKRWGIASIQDVNRYVHESQLEKLIQISEDRYTSQMNEIVARIKKKRGRIRLIMIAGPSSSGKTTFSYRLKDSLAAAGIPAHSISLDNYFKDRQETPKDENGEYDFESIEALDLILLNKDLNSLINHQKIEMPVYNFKTGIKEYKGDQLQIRENEVIIIEGIHGLNPRLTASIPNRIKFGIYVTAMIQLKNHNQEYIHTTSVRFIRRIVRDAQFRGYNAEETIKRWPSVMRGERRNIFPFQADAHYIFNSAMLYELPVLKTFAFELLVEINRRKDVFFEARRLLNLVNYFDFAPQNAISSIPGNSTIREFIGGSQYHY